MNIDMYDENGNMTPEYLEVIEHLAIADSLGNEIHQSLTGHGAPITPKCVLDKIEAAVQSLCAGTLPDVSVYVRGRLEECCVHPNEIIVDAITVEEMNAKAEECNKALLVDIEAQAKANIPSGPHLDRIKDSMHDAVTVIDDCGEISVAYMMDQMHTALCSVLDAMDHESEDVRNATLRVMRNEIDGRFADLICDETPYNIAS